MYYIIQENTFNEKGHDRLLEALNRFGFPYEVIKVKPFVEELEFETERKDVFCFGGLKMARLSCKYGWNPGVLMTKNHDFIVYRNHYTEDLLNWDSRIVRLEEDIPFIQGECFIRPCKDTKAFRAGVYNIVQWNQFQQDVRDGKIVHSALNNDTLIQVASVKRVQKEYRLWIVDGKIITGSQYKIGMRPYFNSNVDPEAMSFCKEMIKKYELAKAFVMDVCLHDGEWKIVECGCINAAGFYEADMQKLIMALEDSFN